MLINLDREPGLNWIKNQWRKEERKIEVFMDLKDGVEHGIAADQIQELNLPDKA